LWQEVTLPAARGVAAHARRRYAEAAEALGALRGRLSALGGSTVQQRWLHMIHRDSLARRRSPGFRGVGPMPALAAEGAS
jgi:hypothetical protein